MYTTVVSALTIFFFVQIALGSRQCDSQTKCQRGLHCFKRNEAISECRRRCPKTWECFHDKNTNPCGQCPEGMKCLQINESVFECATRCLTYWMCNKNQNTLTTETTVDTTTTKTSVPDPLITLEEFNNAMNEAGYNVASSKKYEYIIKYANTAGGIQTKRELAMFLTQILWESDGLKAVREYACVNDGCPKEYRSSDDVPGQYYYGRGYIQLTWSGTYKSASFDLFNDDRLLKNPDLVAQDEGLSFATAFWYWKKHVKKRPEVELGWFGTTTDAVNGLLECGKGPNVHKAKERFKLYVKILKGLNINEEPIESGCY